jgi:two-component system chemotaxis sensor kinase CheA
MRQSKQASRKRIRQPGDLSIDDVASLLVQLEATDLSELGHVQQALDNLAKKEEIDAPIRELLSQASAKVGDILKKKAPEPNTALEEAGKLIQAAMDEIESREWDSEVSGISASTTADPTEARQPAGSDTGKAKETVEPVSFSTESKSAERLDDQTPATPEPDGDEPATISLPSDADIDLLGEFVTESNDYIEGAEAALLALETDPEDAEAVNTVFRAFHTIKGTSAFLGLAHVSEFAHRAESLLSRIRDGEIRCTGGYADLALRSLDMIKELILGVQQALSGEPMVRPPGYDELLTVLDDPEAAGVSSDHPAAPSSEDSSEAESEVAETVSKPDRSVPTEGSDRAERDRPEVPAGLERAPKRQPQPQSIAGGQRVESSVRVRTDRLDRLIDMVGELVIAHSMVAQDATVISGIHHELARKVTHAGKIVRELQDLSMSMRMVPLKATFQKMARLVRDLAHKSGKLVEFQIEGEDTEIDRNMVDILKDPMVHMVRNAIDHGIEPPDEREKAGKPRKGVVRLSAYHAGGNVVVELQDDGRGLDREKIVRKAVANGLIESDKGLSDSEVFNLIFAPGFSTADKITDVSGRGVGMDVVRRNVEALRGRIDISSEAGRGSTFTVRLPLTLAVTDGMLVRVGTERYIIPTISIYMSFRPEPEVLSTVAGRGELVMYRGELMPIFRLHRLFNIEAAIEDPTRGLLVIVDDGDRHCALLVDELLGQQQVVAKSLGEGIGKVRGISGSAILGDGRVGLILDPPGIAAMARDAAVADDSKGTRHRHAA